VHVSGCHGKTRSEGEEGVDDLEGEFSLQDCAGHKDDPQYVAESMLRAHMSYDLRRAGPLLWSNRDGAED
jgi:cellulose synthase A